MATNTSGGTTTSFTNTPQAQDDSYTVSEDLGITYFNVLSNDLGGNAKTLWSIDDTTTDGTTGTSGTDDGTTDLLTKDLAGVCNKTDLGASMWITADGRIAYDTSFFTYLASGETAIDHFTYAIRLSNGTLSWATVTVTITGTNDSPDISVGSVDSAAASLAETDSPLTASGTLTVVDPDTSDTVSVAVTGVSASGNSGSLTNGELEAMFALGASSLDADSGDSSNLGWSFDSGSEAFDYLAAGESLTLTYTVSASDGTSGDTQTVTITITGTNDAPEVSDVSASADEDGSAVTGSFSGDDVDSDDDGTTLTYTITDGPDEGSVVDNGDGTFSFDPGTDFQDLAAGETRQVTFTYEATDSHSEASNSGTVTVTVTGTNDAPVLTVDDSGGVTEDVGVVVGNVTDSGTLSFTDVDQTDTHSVGAIYNGDASWSDGLLSETQVAAITAGFSADSDSWDYSVANADLDFLGAGETITLSFDVTVTDDSGQANDSDTKTVSITVTGSNDAPTVETTVADQHVDEDSLWTFAVPLGTFSDADATDTLTYSATLGNGDPLPDWLTFDPDTRTFSGTPPQDWNGTISLTVVASDGTASTSDTFDLVVDPVNDAPEAAPVVLDAIDEDSGERTITQAELLAGASDVDGDTLTVTSLSIASGGGTLDDNGDGTWTYTPAADDDTSVTFNYTVSDGSLTDSSTATMDILPVDDFIYTSPTPYTGTGDPNDFDNLGNAAGQNLSASATNGNDVIYGGGGADTINGGGGDDIIFGGSGGDTLGGGNDGDALYGGSGADTITGGNNNDLIIGGYGADTLTGSNGADTFAYLSNLDTGDRITDFSQAQSDKLDISALGVASGGFLGAISQAGAVGANQAGYMYDSGTNMTIVYVDTDGVFGADMEIKLDGNIALVSGDFIFGGP